MCVLFSFLLLFLVCLLLLLWGWGWGGRERLSQRRMWRKSKRSALTELPPAPVTGRSLFSLDERSNFEDGWWLAPIFHDTVTFWLMGMQRKVQTLSALTELPLYRSWCFLSCIVCVCVCAYVCACACMCVWERDRQIDRDREQQNNVQWLKCSAPVVCKLLNFRSSILFSAECSQFFWKLDESIDAALILFALCLCHF